MRPRRRGSPCSRRPTRWPARCGTTAASRGTTSRVTAEEVVLGLALALACGFVLAIAIHLSPLLRRAVYPLAVGSQAVPIPVIGVLLVFWWGFGIFPEARRDRADLLLPGAGDDRRRAARRWTPSSSSCCARSTPRAGRRFRFAELPAALPAALERRADRARRGRDRRLHRRDEHARRRGTYAGPRPRDRRSMRAASRRARAYAATVAAVRCSRSRASTPGAWPSGGSRPGEGARQREWRDEAPGSRRPPGTNGAATRRVRSAVLACLAAPACSHSAACGAKQDALSAPRRQALHGDARLVSRTPTTRALYTAIAHGDFRAVGPGRETGGSLAEPTEPLKLLAAGKVDMAISYEPELLLARDQGLKRRLDRRARATAADLDHRAAGSSTSSSVADLKGKTVGTAGIPYQAAMLTAALQRRRA